MDRRAIAPLLLLALLPTPAAAQRPAPESGEAQWIWRPKTAGADGIAVFRKQFYIHRPVYGQIDIAADERYELYVNGRRVGAGQNWRVLNRYDIQPLLVSGRNVVAVRAEKRDSQGPAGLVARVILRTSGGTFVSHSTDATWRASDREQPRWNSLNFEDDAWVAAVSLGELGRTPPWIDGVRTTDG